MYFSTLVIFTCTNECSVQVVGKVARSFGLDHFTVMLAAFVGFANWFTVDIEGLTVADVSEAEAASGLMALCIATGAAVIALSLRD